MKRLKLSTKCGPSLIGGLVVACSTVGCAEKHDSPAIQTEANAPVDQGTIIAHSPAHPHHGLPADGALELDVSPGSNCVGELRVKDEQSPNPQATDDLYQHYSCAYFGGNLVVGIDPPMGRTPPWWTLIRVTVRNWPTPHRPLPKGQYYDATTHILTATMPVSDAAATQGVAVTQYLMIKP